MTHELPSEHPQVVGARLCAEHQSQRAQTNFVIRFFIQGKLLRLVFDTAAPRAAVMDAPTIQRCANPSNPTVRPHSSRTHVSVESRPQLKAAAKVSGAENFVGSLGRNLCRIGDFSTKAKFATKMQNQHARNRPESTPRGCYQTLSHL